MDANMSIHEDIFYHKHLTNRMLTYQYYYENAGARIVECIDELAKAAQCKRDVS